MRPCNAGRRFPAWLGQNSSASKQRRLLGELHTRVSAAAAAVSTDRTGLRTAYLPTLRATLVRPLKDQEAEGIPAVIANMQVGGPASTLSPLPVSGVGHCMQSIQLLYKKSDFKCCNLAWLFSGSHLESMQVVPGHAMQPSRSCI